MTSPRLQSAFGANRASQLAGRTILQLIPELDAGGAERTAIDVAAALANAGARALVACDGGRLISDLQAKGGIWVRFPAKTKNPLMMALNVQRLKRLIAAEKVDIIHARSRAPAWVGYGAARLTKTPFVTTYHGAYQGGSAFKTEYNSVMAKGDVVIANSHYTAGQIVRLYPQAQSRVRVIPRGVDFREFSPRAVDPARIAKLRQAWGVASDARIVLLAARLTAWKGQRVLIEAAAILAARGLEHVAFVLAGDPQGRRAYVREVDGLIAAKGLGGIVKRAGHCADMPAAYMAASVVAVPSTEPEAFGRVAVEAQAMGTPVIVSELGAVPETVLAPPQAPASQRTGWRVPAKDATALADALAEVLALGASGQEALARRARAHVEQHFSLEQMTSETLDAYVALLEGRARR